MDDWHNPKDASIVWVSFCRIFYSVVDVVCKCYYYQLV